MTVVVLAILLTCCLLLLGAALGRAVVLHRRLVSRLDVFRCKVRVESGTVTRLARRWPHRACRAEWSHDVLLLHRGLGFAWTQPLDVHIAEDVIEPVRNTEKVGLGPGAVAFRLRLDDDAVIAVAAPAQAREKLAGPFLAIAVHGLPPGMSERRR
jgi:hypothetical protein